MKKEMETEGPGQLPDDIYFLSKRLQFKITIIATAVLFLGLLINFPLRAVMTQSISHLLQNNPSCQIVFSDLESTLFFPGVEIQRPIIPANCLGTSKNLILQGLNVHLIGPSFVPFGLRLRIQILVGGQELTSYLSLSFGKTVFKIPETVIRSQLIESIIGEDYFQGKVVMEGLFESKGTTLQTGQLKIESTNFSLHPLNISGLALPELPLSQILVKLNLTSPKDLEIVEVIVGHQDAPLLVHSTGKVFLNQANPALSRLDLRGEIKFSKSFLDKFSIINLFLAAKKPVDGMYKFSLTGPITAPQPNFL